MSFSDPVKTELSNDWSDMESEETFTVGETGPMEQSIVQSDFYIQAEHFLSINNEGIMNGAKEILNGQGENTNKFECPDCGKVYASNGGLKTHLTIHSGEKPHKCEICNKAFRLPHILRRHNMMRHTDEKPYKCELCKKSFSLPRTLKCHIMCHTDERPHSCEICKKTFRQQAHLNEHLLCHTDQKPHKCETCTKEFRLLVHLKRHLMCHGDERPYKCEVCKKGFRQLQSLKLHMMVHTGEKPYTCEICKKGFRRQEHLTEHLVCHTDGKPYKCEECKKTFRQIRSLRVHMKYHTEGRPSKKRIIPENKALFISKQGEKRYQCHLCTKNYGQNSHLNRHLLKFHKAGKMFGGSRGGKSATLRSDSEFKTEEIKIEEIHIDEHSVKKELEFNVTSPLGVETYEHLEKVHFAIVKEEGDVDHDIG